MLGFSSCIRFPPLCLIIDYDKQAILFREKRDRTSSTVYELYDNGGLDVFMHWICAAVYVVWVEQNSVWRKSWLKRKRNTLNKDFPDKKKRKKNSSALREIICERCGVFRRCQWGQYKLIRQNH